LDVDAVRAAAVETEAIVTIEEHGLDAGFGSAIAEVCMDLSYRPRTFLRIGLPNRFVSTVGTQDYLRNEYGLDANNIAQKTARALQTKICTAT
jgi:transketolase C-terminal domain/subunit